MKNSTEYTLALKVIAKLRQEKELAQAVLDQPWSRADQATTVLLSVGQYGDAVAVVMYPPTVLYPNANDVRAFCKHVAGWVILVSEVILGADKTVADVTESAMRTVLDTDVCNGSSQAYRTQDDAERAQHNAIV